MCFKKGKCHANLSRYVFLYPAEKINKRVQTHLIACLIERTKIGLFECISKYLEKNTHVLQVCKKI